MKLFTCYAGKNVSFEEVKDEFLSMYPSFKTTEFRHAAQAILSTKLNPNNIFCGMTKLENASRAVVEAYIKNEKLSQSDFNEHTEIPGTPPPTSATTTAATTSSSNSSTTQASTSATPQPPATGQAQSNLKLLDFLQNFAMHLFVSAQTANKVYDTLAYKGQKNSSTKFMAETVRAIEKNKLLTAGKKTEKSTEVIWTANYRRQGDNRQGDNRQNDSKERPAACFNCGKLGHWKKDCNICSYCQKPGHTTKQCGTRLAQAKGKWCEMCKISDSHNSDECFRNNKARKTTT